MDKVKNVPEIRFKGFCGEWENIKFKNVGEFYSGGTPLSSNADYYNGNIPFIRSGEIDKNKTELFLAREGLINSSARLVKKGDVLLALYGATSGEISISKIDGAINQAILAIIPDENFSNYFIENYFVIKKEEINSKYLQGGQKNLSGKIIKSIACIFPSGNEQTQIGDFFKNLDEKLELEKEKHEKLINFKKAMLEDMFPKEGEKVPKVRLDGFDDEWGFEAIKNLFYKKSAKSKVERTIDNGKFLIMDMGSVSETGNNISYKRTNCAEDIIDEEGLIMPKDDIGGGKIIGRTAYVDQDNKYVLSDHVYLLYKLTENIIPLFAHYQINSSNFNKKIKRITTGSAQLGISWTNVGEEQLRTPSSEEQVLIGTFFKNLDEKIELSEKKITKIENFKKAMLEKMFV